MAYYFDNGVVTQLPPESPDTTSNPPAATRRPLDQYVRKVRMYLRDFKAKNQLTEDIDGNPIEENTEEEIRNAIEFVYYDAIQAPPVRFNMPLSEMSKKLWFLWGVIAFILDSTALENVRNALPVSDGGVSIDPETYRATTYSNIAANLTNKYNEGLMADKIRYNYQNFYGGQGYGTDPPSAMRYGWYGNAGLYY